VMMTEDLYERRCVHCGAPSDFVYCNKCAKTERCQHGNVINDGCPECDYAGDQAFDGSREKAAK